MNKLDAAAVRAQVDRILGSRHFSGVKTAWRLREVVEMVLAGRSEPAFEWESLDAALFREDVHSRDEDVDPNESRGSRVRGAIRYMRRRVAAYYQNEGRKDALRIQWNDGSYQPVIFVQTSPVPAMAEVPGNVWLRTKIALDARTWGGDLRAMQYANLLIDEDNVARSFIRFQFVLAVVAPRFPAAVKYARRRLLGEIATELLGSFRESEANTWEAMFLEACEAAARFDWTKALEWMERAVDVSRGEAASYWWYPALLMSQKHEDRAFRVVEGIVSHFGRTSASLHLDLAMLHLMKGNFQASREAIDAAGEIAPESPVVTTYRALWHEARGENDAAMEAIGSLFLDVAVTPDSLGHFFRMGHWTIAVFGMVAGLNGAKLGKMIWRSLLDHADAGKMAYTASQAALVAVGIGKHEEAVRLLRAAAYDDRDPLAMWYHLLPPLRHLRQREDFRALLRDLELPSV